MYLLTPLGGELYGDRESALLYTGDGENNKFFSNLTSLRVTITWSLRVGPQPLGII